MQRVRTTTAIPDNPGYTAGGTPGFFTEGNPAASLPATVPGADWCNMMQAEPLNVILEAGLTPDEEDDTQLLQAILALIAANAPTPGAATETVAGIAQIATTEEVEAGTDDATIITPAKLAAVLAAFSGGISMYDALTCSLVGR